MHKKRGFFVLILVILFLLSTNISIAYKTTDENSVSSIIKTTAGSDEWTVMMYMAFDNHRTYEKDYTFNFLTSVGSGPDFNLIGLYDGKFDGDTAYYFIEKDLLIPLTWYETESDMGHSETLKRFLELTIHNYPADHYALFILSTHGSGWQGLGCDTHGTETFSDLSLLDMNDYKEVLKDVTNNGSEKIDVIAFNICVTASIEAAYQISPYARYMVSNEEHGFGGGEYSDEGKPLEWNFTSFLQELKDNTDMTPKSFAESIVDTYEPGMYTSKIAGVVRAPGWYPITVFKTDLSATDLSKIGQLADSIKQLSENLTENICKSKKGIKTARSKVREYGKLYRRFWWLPSKIAYPLQLDPLGYDCFIDLYDFIEKLKDKTGNANITTACNNVMNAMNTTIIANVSLPYDPSHGLFIYFPQMKCQYDASIWRVMGSSQFRKIPMPYWALDFSYDTNWDLFLRKYLNICPLCWPL